MRLNVTPGERAALLDAQNTGQREWMELRASREEQRRLVAATERPLPPAYLPSFHEARGSVWPSARDVARHSAYPLAAYTYNHQPEALVDIEHSFFG